MKRLRAVGRVARLAITCSGWYAAVLLGSLLLLPLPAARRRWRSLILKQWARSVCAALAVRVEVVGPLPPKGSLVVSNHLGYLDIPVIGSALGFRFVSRADVANWPVVGLLARSGGTIFLERERKRQLHEINDSITQALAHGDGVVVFPEGTSTRGAEVLPFRPSLLAPAADAQLDVHCAVLSYATEPGDPPPSLSIAWWGDAPFAPHVSKLLQLRRISARLEFARGSVRDADRKRLAEKLWQVVNQSFRPLP